MDYDASHMNKRISIQIFMLAIIVLANSCASERLISRRIANQIKNRVGVPEYIQNNEGIVVVTVGTSSPLRSERAESGTSVFVNDNFFMFDVGAGVVQESQSIGLPLDQLDAVFLTHYHSDHMIDLPNIISSSWLAGRNKS